MIEIAHRDYLLRAAPAQGGAITHFSWRDHDVLRPALEPARNGFETSCFPLAAFSNRIANAQFNFREREIRLERNFADAINALHGQAWLKPWQVGDVKSDRARMSFDYPGADWPWAYRCTQELTLDDSGLLLGLALQNLSDEPMPASVGWHPYFPRPLGVRIKTHVTGVWRTDAALVPTHFDSNIELPELARGTTLDAAPFIDSCYAGWDRMLEIAHRDHGVRMTASPDLKFFHLYAPKDDHFCAEPISAMPDAVHHADQAYSGLRVLEPGESWAVWSRIEASTDWKLEA